MADTELIDRIAAGLAGGVPEEQIRAGLAQEGYAEGDVNGAIAVAKLRKGPQSITNFAAPPPEPPAKSHWLSNVLVTLLMIAAIGSVYVVATQRGTTLMNQVFAKVMALQEASDPMFSATVPDSTATTTDSGSTAATTTAPAQTPPATAGTPVTTPAKPVAPVTKPTAPSTPVATLPVPTVSFSASGTNVPAGSSLTLTWSSTNATSCTGSGFPTSSRTSGSATVKVYGTFDFSVTCSNASHSATKAASVTVSGA